MVVSKAKKMETPLSHYSYDLPSEEEERLGKLFGDLDFNGDGIVDIHDLSEGLKRLGVPGNFQHGYAQKFLEQSDQNQSGDITLAEFIHYVKEHEKRLKLLFSHVDKNKDGRIDSSEIMSAFKDLGIHIDRKEALSLLKRMENSQKYQTRRRKNANGRCMDREGTLEISFDEWRDYLLFHPTADLQSIIQYWRHSTAPYMLQYMDVGETTAVPDDFTLQEMLSGMWWRHLVAGGVAGAVSRTATAPLDRLKVFLQVHGLNHFGSLKACLRHMYQEGGMRSLWRGNGINVLKIAPESALKFMAYEQAKLAIRGNTARDLLLYERFVAGSLAGCFSQTLIYPLEVLKTRLALRTTGQYKGIWDAATKLYAREGFGVFFRGYVPNLLGIIPYAGIDLAVYETLKKSWLDNHSGGDKPTVWVLLGCGTVSSTCGQIASYPLALVRTRLQAAAQLKTSIPATAAIATGPTPTGTTSASQQVPLTMTSVFRNIIATEGLPGLYRGITPNFMKVAPAVSISYVVYEHCRQALGVTMT